MICLAKQQDREAFFAMAKQFYASAVVSAPVPESYHERAFAQAMQGNTYMELFIFGQDVPAGYAITAFTYSHEAGGRAVWLDELFILPEYRGQGLGTQFLAYMEERYKGAARLRLEVAPGNQKAMELYKSLGYQPLFYRQMVKDSPSETES